MPTWPLANIGGLVLCGGKSTRMGSPKHALQFGDEVMLQRVCRILAEVVQPIVVVAARDQELPALASDIHIVRDEFDACGPLAGIATGLQALEKLNASTSAAFVTACDCPLMKPEFIASIVSHLQEHDVAVPVDGEHVHVLSAVYQLRLAGLARELIESGKRRPLTLLEQSTTHRISVDNLRSVDPELDSLRNTNTPEAYATVLQLIKERR